MKTEGRWIDISFGLIEGDCNIKKDWFKRISPVIPVPPLDKNNLLDFQFDKINDLSSIIIELVQKWKKYRYLFTDDRKAKLKSITNSIIDF